MKKVKAAFLGFGEVNTPIDIIIRKCEGAAKALESMMSAEVREAQSKANIKKVADCYVDSVVLDMYVDAYEELLGGKIYPHKLRY